MQSNLILGPVNIDPSLINSLRSQLEEAVMPAYLDLKEVTNQKLQADPDYYNKDRGNGLPCRRLDLGYIVIPDLPIRDISYNLQLFHNISSLTLESPLGALASIVNNFIKQYGIKFDRVELRFEKACFNAYTNYWHFDGLAGRHAFSLCWSSRKNWNTYITDPEEINKIRFDLKFRGEFLTPEWEEKIKPFIQPAKEDYIYDVKRVLHRAPVLEDLHDEPLTQNDWRIFLRFTDESY